MIVSSTYKIGHAQIDGRHYVSEVHIDQDGVEYNFEYLDYPEIDYAAVLIAHRDSLVDSLSVSEFNEQIA